MFWRTVSISKSPGLTPALTQPLDSSLPLQSNFQQQQQQHVDEYERADAWDARFVPWHGAGADDGPWSGDADELVVPRDGSDDGPRSAPRDDGTWPCSDARVVPWDSAGSDGSGPSGNADDGRGHGGYFVGRLGERRGGKEGGGSERVGEGARGKGGAPAITETVSSPHIIASHRIGSSPPTRLQRSTRRFRATNCTTPTTRCR